MKLKYCCKNLKKRTTDQTYEWIGAMFPDVKQKKKDCLGCCKMCSKQCVVAVGKKKDRQYICAEDADQLYLKLKELLA